MTSYPIRFTKEQLIVLNKALVELSYREAAPLIFHINKQIEDLEKMIKEDCEV